jgi:hypothetical protein
MVNDVRVGRVLSVIDSDVSTAYGIVRQIQLMPLNQSDRIVL